jgi:riboflavin biosynthesis pyrimidine reductase
VESQVPEVEPLLWRLYGVHTLAALPTAGVLHVTSVVRSGGALCVIAIGEDAPRSEGDFFVLELARARADAILTTAAIVRAEPALSLALVGPQRDELARHRAAAGKGAPTCAILTRSGTLPTAHPLWDDGTRKLVLTVPAQSDRLRSELRDRAEVVALEGLDARRAVAYLRERGAALISIEAGPSANAALYDEPALVDELSLSIFEGAGPRVATGGPLAASLLHGMRCVADNVRDELSGRWRYQRWLRG